MSRTPIRPRLNLPVLAAGLLVSAGLAAAGWVDYGATRRELLDLLRDQALSLRATMAAAVRSSRAAATQAERELRARLLDNARLLGEIDRRQPLDQATLDEVVRRNGLFRVTVFDAAGRRERTSGGRGFGFGQGAGGGPLLSRLLGGQDVESATEVHAGRGSGEARVAAGVRRAGGGAIILNADASAVDAIRRTYSLDAMLADMAQSTAELVYVDLSAGGVRLTHGVEPGVLPPPEPAAPDPAGDVTERERVVGGQPVLELTGPLPVEGFGDAVLRLGMRLDGVQRAERRTLVRLFGSLSTVLLLTLVAIGFLGLRREYGVLSLRHQAAEAALRRRDRLTAMGELASTVAHEVRNPLNAIAMAARRLSREFIGPAAGGGSDADELRELLAIVEGETQRINGIVQQFLEFARPPALVRRDVDLEELAGTTAEAHRPLATTRGVTLEVAAQGAGRAWLDPAQIRQVLDNLLRNGIEATPPDGRVSLRVRRERRAHVFEVDDTGAGIAPDDLPKVFDLYFTTKAHGTGIGLAVAHQIVTAHGGTIEVRSEPGSGTRMSVRLPDEKGDAGRA